MRKTLTKHGNSYALVIDRPIMELLRITPETELEISTDGKILTITPSDGGRKPKSVKSALDRVNAKHGKALRRLAQ
ncbi:MAG: AbrB/MazE/SpoVT family DNA-binding domain-containing protein [bacterium]